MSDASSVETILTQAGEREKEYDWLGAVEFYQKAMSMVPETDFLKLGQVQEKVGYAFFRAAMQAESQEEFKDRMRQAIVQYEKAKEFYQKTNGQGEKPSTTRCNAMIAYAGCWLASEALEKKRLLGECWKLAKESLKAFKDADDAWEYGMTYNQLSSSAILLFLFELDFKTREKLIGDAVLHGEQAVEFLSIYKDSCELARAYGSTASFLELYGYYFRDLDGREKCFQKAKYFWQKANELSEEVAFLESCSGMGALSLDLGIGTDKALENAGKVLEYARRTRDRLRVGYALELLTIHTYWRSLVDDPNEAVESLNRALKYAEDARNQYSPTSFVSGIGDVLWVEAPYAEYYWNLAASKTDLSERRELLKRAMEATPDLLNRAQKSGCFQDIYYAHHVASKVLTFQAMMETNSEEKKMLLEKALEHRNETIDYTAQHLPFDYWDQGVMLMYLAGIKNQLADLSKDLESRKNMLQEAAVDAENALKLCVKDLAFYDRGGTISQSNIVVGNWQHGYGTILKRLYDITNNTEYLRKAIEAFEDSAESAQKLGFISRMAESNWKTAQMYDALDNHLKAAESFDLASGNYRTGAEKIPQLRDLYQDLSLYMKAWSEIEKARHHHKKQEYGSAEEHFEKAAGLHKLLKQWSYLTPNYLAWAKVEQAEDLSRKEQNEDAMQAFEQAAKLFNEAKKSLQAQLNQVEDPDEKQMATGMVKATDERREYCIGRIVLEEAKILDKKGDHYSSSQKYASAAEIFEKIADRSQSEQDRKELKLIITLSQAWQKMMLAEARASPQLCTEASQLFEQASECSSSEKTGFLTLGHSRFCKALEAGTRFADTRDQASHALAIQHLESAANYYLKAGFAKASEYAKATELLFDAYLHMDDAKKEKIPEKKARLYAMAEKVLQTSAGSFMKAEHPEKSEQVLKLLEKVKEERELAMSLSEVLHAPTIVSATTAFSAPPPTHESAVGSERFEHADIQANMVTRQKELKVGENLNLEIELVNAGKGPALLTKITEIVPEGFELTEKPEMYRVEDSYLNMRGKRLDPLKMEEVKLVLRPRAQGVFPLKPKILYLDENGKYKSHEPEPVTITVKELGIKGWLKGEK